MASQNWLQSLSGKPIRIFKILGIWSKNDFVSRRHFGIEEQGGIQNRMFVSLWWSNELIQFGTRGGKESFQTFNCEGKC